MNPRIPKQDQVALGFGCINRYNAFEILECCYFFYPGFTKCCLALCAWNSFDCCELCRDVLGLKSQLFSFYLPGAFSACLVFIIGLVNPHPGSFRFIDIRSNHVNGERRYTSTWQNDINQVVISAYHGVRSSAFLLTIKNDLRTRWQESNLVDFFYTWRILQSR